MIEQLVAKGFRNLDEAPFRPGGGRQLLVGPNGAGKSSLVEAIYVAATTRSFRTSDLTRCRRFGATAFEIELTVGGARPARLFIGRGVDGMERRVDGGRTSLADHLGILPVVSLSEADRPVLAGDTQARRKFLDRGVVAERPRLIETISRYRQALASKRLVLLRRGSDLDAWNEMLAREGAVLVAARRDHLRRTDVALGKLAARIGFEGQVRLEYRPSPARLGDHGESDEGALEAALGVAFAEARTREVESARSLVGPHRDRLVITWRGEEVAGAASAGERKLCGWLLALARAEVVTRRGRAPLVILDDADAELDRDRLAAAWSLVGEGTNLIATSSRPEAWKGLELERAWGIEGGRIVGLSA